jgi:hypothetical protein
MPITNRSDKIDATVSEVLQGATPATAANYGTFFVADRKYKVKGVRVVHGTASSSGTVQVEKLTGTQAKAAGVGLLASAASTAGTANTVLSPALTSTGADLLLAVGDRLGLSNGGTLTSSAQLVVEVILTPMS